MVNYNLHLRNSLVKSEANIWDKFESIAVETPRQSRAREFSQIFPWFSPENRIKPTPRQMKLQT